MKKTLIMLSVWMTLQPLATCFAAKIIRIIPVIHTDAKQTNLLRDLIPSADERTQIFVEGVGQFPQKGVASIDHPNLIVLGSLFAAMKSLVRKPAVLSSETVFDEYL